MLDEQIRHKATLENQGTMTQTEKTMNKGFLDAFKAQKTGPTTMIPGIFNEEPFRNATFPKKELAILKKRIRAIMEKPTEEKQSEGFK